MSSETLVKSWFNKWETGDFHDLPLAKDFKHTSPYGIIDGKAAYISLVEDNREMFLGNRFEFHDAIYEHDRATVRYTMISKNSRLEVSEWIYVEGSEIKEIVAYYNLESEMEAGRGIELKK